MADRVVELVFVVRTTAAPPPTGVIVATYPVIVAPPLLFGAVTVMVSVVEENEARLEMVGELGATAG